MEIYVHLWLYLAELFLELEMFQTKLVEKIKTHLKFKNFFFFENRAVCVKIRKNVVERGWPHDNIIRRMHFLIFRTRLKRRTFHWAGRLMLSAQPYVSSPPPPMAQQPLVGQGFFIIETSQSYSDAPHLVGLLWTCDKPDLGTSTWQHATLTTDRYQCPRRDSNP